MEPVRQVGFPEAQSMGQTVYWVPLHRPEEVVAHTREFLVALVEAAAVLLGTTEEQELQTKDTQVGMVPTMVPVVVAVLGKWE